MLIVVVTVSTYRYLSPAKIRKLGILWIILLRHAISSKIHQRQQYFELFVDYFGKKLGVSDDMRRRKIIGLAKTRWVEQHKAYDNYYLLYRCTIAVFESITQVQK